MTQERAKAQATAETHTVKIQKLFQSITSLTVSLSPFQEHLSARSRQFRLHELGASHHVSSQCRADWGAR